MGMTAGEALERVADDPLPFVIGGAQIYAEALPRVTRLFVTEVDRDAVGDAHFPAFDRDAFEEVLREAGETPGVTFVEWARRTPHEAGR